MPEDQGQETLEKASEEKITVGLIYFRSLQDSAKAQPLLNKALMENHDLKKRVVAQHEEIKKLSASLVTTSKMIESPDLADKIKIKLNPSELSQWSMKEAVDGNKFDIKNDIFLTYDRNVNKVVSFSYS